MGNSSSENRIRKVYTLTISPEIFGKFRSECGLVPASRQIEELMKAWIDMREEERKNIRKQAEIAGVAMAIRKQREKAVGGKGEIPRRIPKRLKNVGYENYQGQMRDIPEDLENMPGANLIIPPDPPDFKSPSKKDRRKSP